MQVVADTHYNNGLQFYKDAEERGDDRDDDLLLSARNEFHTALELYMKEDSTDPHRIANCFVYIASILHNQGLLDDALERYQMATRILVQTSKQWRSHLFLTTPDSLLIAEAENSMGNIYRRTGRLEEAVKAYEKALLIFESHSPFSLQVADTKVFMAIALVEQKKYCLANAHLLQSHAILVREEHGQNNVRLMNCKYHLAITALENKRYLDALKHIEFVIEHKPMYKFALLLKARILKQMGSVFRARRVCEHLIEIDKSYHDAHALLDDIHQQQRECINEKLQKHVERVNAFEQSRTLE